MQRRTTKFSPNRRIAELGQGDEAKGLASAVGYGGNPEHKRNPGDFGLIPPAQPRLGKTLCDETAIFTRKEALELLREGARRGLVSEQKAAGEVFPQMIWAVTDGKVAMEARIENPGTGAYHGYPMPSHDPLRPDVLRLWAERAPPVPRKRKTIQ
jgi:hypothetical protein